MKKFFAGLKYVLLNKITNHIPFWNLRKCIYKMLGMKIGKGSRIGIYTIILSPQKIIIGENSIINENCFLDGRGGIIIENNCSVSNYSKIITGSHIANSDDFTFYAKEVHIENNVWIGTSAIILDGSKLSKYSVIGAGCVYKGLSKEKGIYIGNPAKMIKLRNIQKEYVIKHSPFFR